MDDTGYTVMLVKCSLLGGLAGWGLDLTWVLALSELEHLEVVSMDVETFLLDGLVCMQSA
eukprot:1161791-Pelagomonas_calceolata.AAC.6